MSQEKIQKTALRLPKSLHDQVLASGDANERTMNAEIIYQLRQAYASSATLATVSQQLVDLKTQIESLESRLNDE